MPITGPGIMRSTIRRIPPLAASPVFAHTMELSGAVIAAYQRASLPCADSQPCPAAGAWPRAACMAVTAGGHRSVDRRAGSHCTGVRTIDLTEIDTVERHTRVMNSRLKLAHGFIQYRAVNCGIRNHRQAPSCDCRANGWGLPSGFAVMP